MTVLAEGKTKVIKPDAKNPAELVEIYAKDDITAGDGAKRDMFPNKGYYSTATNANVFQLLSVCRIPVAFDSYEGGIMFRAARCEMLPYEVVIRRVALGSYLKRNPHVRREHRFNTLVVEFFLKTNGGEFRGIKFLKDDPYIGAYSIQGLSTYRPDMPVNLADASAIHVGADTIYAKDKDVCHPFKLMEEIARKVFLVVEKAWDIQDCTLCDLKIEFGHTTKGELVVADVIDNDSWRLFDDRRRHLDKQRYRDGAEISEVESLYKNVAERTTRFGEQPFKCDIVLWCASEKDDPRPFFDELKKYGLTTSLIHLVRSVHKAPEESLLMLRSALADRKYAVIITYVGRSNGAGPVIQGDTHFPVIGVPANWKDCPEDVWSSLRMPSDIPMTTVLDPANAIQAALGMLSMHNPVAYLARRSIVENQKLARGNSPTHAMNF